MSQMTLFPGFVGAGHIFSQTEMELYGAIPEN